MDKQTIKSKLINFKRKISRDIIIQRFILFGSRAIGKSHKYSDIDLIIVSPEFRKLDFIQRGLKMYEYWDLKTPVDFLCYTPEEFQKLSKQITLVSKAIKEGIEL